MKLCPRCATENAAGADFCVVCGEYLRWEPTRALEALTPADVSAGTPAADREHAARRRAFAGVNQAGRGCGRDAAARDAGRGAGAGFRRPAGSGAGGAATFLLRLPDEERRRRVR